MTDLLWLSAETPDRDGGGGQRRQFHQIRALVAHGVQIAVATLAGPQSDVAVRSLSPVYRFPSRSRWRTRNRALEDTIEVVAPARAVVAHVESLPHVLPELARGGVPLLVDFQNVLSRWYQALGEEGEAAAWRERERFALQAADRSTVCSPEEQRALLELGTATRIDVSPHGVDPAEWPPSSLSETRDRTLTMFASWDHTPNRFAAQWLVDEVWPLVRGGVPDARLLLIGPGEMPSTLRERDGVETEGRVSSLASFLGRTRIAVVPIQTGMGARMKFIESLASGAAVVATSAGSEGFDVDGAFIRADDPTSFADGCIDLLRDPERAVSLGAHGRDVALTRYPWERVVEPILGFAGGR